VPATALALMPKCPMCVAAYVALFTGLGLSLPAATAIRTMLIVLCAASLVFMGWRSSMRAVRSKKPRPIPVGALSLNELSASRPSQQRRTGATT
jgi:hypothetical protein